MASPPVDSSQVFPHRDPPAPCNSSLTRIPFFLDGVAGSSSLNQADGIHPTGEGYRLIVEKIFPALEPLLARTR